jgi:MqsR-controlled colanic acid and biofilm protein A
MMKKLLYFSAVITLAAFPLITQAAPAQELPNGTTLKQEMGSVSAKASTIDELDAKLQAEATQKGASGYTVTSAIDNHKGVYGTATLYK